MYSTVTHPRTDSGIHLKGSHTVIERTLCLLFLSDITKGCPLALSTLHVYLWIEAIKWGLVSFLRLAVL